MSKTIQAIYEDGVFRPTEPVDLPEHTTVEVEIPKVEEESVGPPRTWGDGLLRSAGAMAPFWTPEDDQILADIERERRRPSTREIPE